MLEIKNAVVVVVPIFLKVVSATVLLVCFLSLNESTCQTRKNAFYLTSKALFMMSSNA